MGKLGTFKIDCRGWGQTIIDGWSQFGYGQTHLRRRHTRREAVLLAVPWPEWSRWHSKQTGPWTIPLLVSRSKRSLFTYVDKCRLFITRLAVTPFVSPGVANHGGT